jgi:hypothetical protein
MQKAYKDLDIQFLPDSVISELNKKQLSTAISNIDQSLLTFSKNLTDYVSTQTLSTENLIQVKSSFVNLDIINSTFSEFLTHHFEKLI